MTLAQSSIGESLICQVCANLIVNPVECKNCGYIICKECAMKCNNRCIQKCGFSFTEEYQIHRLHRLAYDDLRFNCPNKCGAILTY